MSITIDDSVQAAAASEVFAGRFAFDQWWLPKYDVLVFGINNPFFWRCSTQRQIDMFTRLCTAKHMDVGVGSGYFLDHCDFPVAQPDIALVDLNENTLAHVRQRLRRYEKVRLYRRNILEPFDIGERFSSISANYLLHCVPGPIEDKADKAFGNLKRHLAPDGVLFGSTLLMDLARRHLLTVPMMRVYQRYNVFHNQSDTLEGLRQALSMHFEQFELEVAGAAALFTARKPII